MTEQAPGRELVRAAEPLLDREGHNNIARIANTLGKASVFPDVKSAADAYAKILLGRSIGLGPMQAMTGIHIVDGKPQIASTTLAAFVLESPDYDYEIVEHDAAHCAIDFFRLRDGEEPKKLGTSTFTIEEAKAAELGKWPDEQKWAKSQWGKWPRNMVFARAMSNGVKWYCPDLFGGVPVYTEADEFTDRLQITAGEGDGQPEGIALPDDVEAIITRAQAVGHAALANRAAVEVAIGGVEDAQSVEAWIEHATAELDAAEAAPARESTDVEIDEAEPVEADALPAEDDAEGWRERSAARLVEWEAEVAFCKARSEPETPHAKRLKHEADTALQTAMNIEEGGGVQAEVRRVEGGGEDA